ILHDHRADGGIGPGAPQAASAQCERHSHEPGVFRVSQRWHRSLRSTSAASGRPIYVIPSSISLTGASMLISGTEKLERMRDGRAIYIGAERVSDVTHPAFRNAARTIADLYDLKADPQQHDLFSIEENGERYGLWWLRCRTREDLVRRMRAMKAIADATYGLIGRSPDRVAGLVTGLAMKPAPLDALNPGFGENLTRYYEYARKNDLYISFAVMPPAGIRSREIFTGEARDDPTLRVIAEADDGVTISGMKMLATGAVFADEVWIGNLTP